MKIQRIHIFFQNSFEHRWLMMLLPLIHVTTKAISLSLHVKYTTEIETNIENAHALQDLLLLKMLMLWSWRWALHII